LSPPENLEKVHRLDIESEPLSTSLTGRNYSWPLLNVNKKDDAEFSNSDTFAEDIEVLTNKCTGHVETITMVAAVMVDSDEGSGVEGRDDPMPNVLPDVSTDQDSPASCLQSREEEFKIVSVWSKGRIFSESTGHVIEV